MQFVPLDARTLLASLGWVLAALIAGAAASASFARAPAAAWAEPAGDEAPFLAENDAAMTKMRAGMAVKPTGDIDRDFVAMMAPHHQGAIDMAQALLRHGSNEQLKRLAQEIIVTQQQEIAVMRMAIGEPSAAPSPMSMKNGQIPSPRKKNPGAHR
jgi:uncharacterized protein (DUF305 family)